MEEIKKLTEQDYKDIEQAIAFEKIDYFNRLNEAKKKNV